MTEHVGLPVAGYVAQSQSNVDIANEGKELEERYMRWLDKLANVVHPEDHDKHLSERRRTYDPRCIAEARTCIQTGAMFAIRSIFQPQRIKLPEDLA